MTRRAARSIDVPMQWTGERNGQYRGTFVSGAPGMYATKVEATREGKALGSGQTHVRAAPGDAEYFDATMHAARLRRIAEETGGRSIRRRRCGTLRRGPEVHRPGRDHGRRARPLAHADHPAAAGRADVRRMGLSPSGRDGVSSACGRARCEVASAKASEGGAPRALRSADRAGGIALTRLSFVFAVLSCVTLLLSAAPAYAQATHLAVIVGLAGEPEHAELFHALGRRRWSMRPRSWGSRTSIYLAEKPEAIAKRVTGRSTKDEIVKAFDKLARRRGRRRRLHRPDRPWHVRRQGGEVQPAGTGPDAGRLRAAAEEGCKSRHVVFVNTASASGPFIEALAGSRPDDRDRDAHRRRAVCDAVRRLLRRCAGGYRRRRRQEPAHLGARSLHLREARSRRRRTSAKGSC